MPPGNCGPGSTAASNNSHRIIALSETTQLCQATDLDPTFAKTTCILPCFRPPVWSPACDDYLAINPPIRRHQPPRTSASELRHSRDPSIQQVQLNMASRKKVLLKVLTESCYIGLPGGPRGLTLTNASQVIILGDSGVGKTSLMNQYVRRPSYGPSGRTSRRCIPNPNPAS